jgi:hypothetical protein
MARTSPFICGDSAGRRRMRAPALERGIHRETQE